MGLKQQQFSEAFPPKAKFTTADFPDLSGRVAIVTGANTGLGKATAKVLLQKRCRVYIAARSESKATEAIADLRKQTGNNQVFFLKLDLSDLASISSTVNEFLGKEKQLHLLFNNAGVMNPPVGSKTPQGHELQIGTNLLGPYLFTKLLLPIMCATADREASRPKEGAKAGISDVRIIHTSSMAHISAPTSWDAWVDPSKAATGMALYGQSKWGNIVLSNEIARRYGKSGIISHSLSPGLVTSDLQRHMPAPVRVTMHMVFKTADQGCMTQLAAGLLPKNGDLSKNGLYFIPYGRVGLAREDVHDEELGRRLWTWLEEQVAPYA